MVFVGDGVDEFGFGVEVEFDGVEEVSLGELDFGLEVGGILRVVVLVLLCPGVGGIAGLLRVDLVKGLVIVVRVDLYYV